MLSRVANSIYWMSRYIERAENIARFVHVNLHLMLDMPDLDGKSQWMPMINVTGDRGLFVEKYGEANERSALQFLTFDPEYPNSIVSCLREARENARTVREVISSETWEDINRYYQFAMDAARNPNPPEDLNRFYTELKSRSHLILGVMDSTITHGDGWHFSRMGRLIERADKTSRLLDVKYFLLLPSIEDVGSTLDKVHWAAVLKSVSGLEMYRKQYQRITPFQVTRFLILDRLFPRSIHYCLIKAEESLHAITGAEAATFNTNAEQRLGRLRAKFDYMTIEEIFNQGAHEFLDEFQTRLNEVGQAIFETFFAIRMVKTHPSVIQRATQ